MFSYRYLRDAIMKFYADTYRIGLEVSTFEYFRMHIKQSFKI